MRKLQDFAKRDMVEERIKNGYLVRVDNISSRIQRVMTEQNLNSVGFAKLVGLSQSTITWYLKYGKNPMTIKAAVYERLVAVIGNE